MTPFAANKDWMALPSSKPPQTWIVRIIAMVTSSVALPAEQCPPHLFDCSVVEAAKTRTSADRSVNAHTG
eukprot:1191142-Prorocentrum_minimum.AAC.1